MRGLSPYILQTVRKKAAMVARTGASMIVNPGSIAIIDGESYARRWLSRKQAETALWGSDQAPGNNCHNIFNEMKT